MECRKCGREIPADAAMCCYCGASVKVPLRRKKSRGNGQGSVYQLPNGKYVALKVCYYLGADGKKHRATVSKRFDKKKDAVAALPTLTRTRPVVDAAAEKVLEQLPAAVEQRSKTTLKELYELWLPTHQAGDSTLGNYKAAFAYFKPIHHLPAAEIDIEDLQECIDECPRGKSTRRNMRTVAGLIYKYGIPRRYFPEKLDLSQFLVVKGEAGAGGVGLPDDYLEAIRRAAGAISGADYLLAHCYLGFRPSELLALSVETYDAAGRAFVGGSKTKAGKDRTVTVSPKIQPIIDRLTAGRTTGAVFCGEDGRSMSIKQYRALFYGVLDALGLENPTFTVNGLQRHTYTPHSCRHTFATLMKRVEGSNKDKLELIGHSSEEMLRYYQDVNLEDLRKITDKI